MKLKGLLLVTDLTLKELSCVIKRVIADNVTNALSGCENSWLIHQLSVPQIVIYDTIESLIKSGLETQKVYEMKNVLLLAML